MERIIERPGALDVHQESVMACVRVWDGREVEEHAPARWDYDLFGRPNVTSMTS
jgi:hypothetical protein